MLDSMTTQTAPRHRQSRSTVPLDPALRALRVEVARWALATGHPLNLDAIGVILGARHAEAAIDGRPFNRWTTNSVLTFLFGTAAEWCEHHQVTMPPHLGESLLTYVSFLTEARVLATGSSTPRQLHNTISDLAGLTVTGHRGSARPDHRPATPTPIHRRTPTAP